MTAEELARTFRDLHRPGDPLLLANCWDAGSARLFADCGVAAMATTSAGLAWAHGYPDGGALPLSVLATAVAQIARVIRVPLTVDIEAGYSGDAANVGAVVEAILDAGGIGINLEDGRDGPELLEAKIAAARAVGDRLGVPLFINARTDVYLRALVPPASAVDEVVRRAARYRSAGADGIFPAGVVASEEIRAITSAAAMPVNVLVEPDLPPVGELRRLGVARVSTGSGIAQLLQRVAREAAMGFLINGRYELMLERSTDYAEINLLHSTSPGKEA